MPEPRNDFCLCSREDEGAYAQNLTLTVVGRRGGVARMLRVTQAYQSELSGRRRIKASFRVQMMIVPNVTNAPTQSSVRQTPTINSATARLPRTDFIGIKGSFAFPHCGIHPPA
jgi:hypothetical protein